MIRKLCLTRDVTKILGFQVAEPDGPVRRFNQQHGRITRRIKEDGDAPCRTRMVRQVALGEYRRGGVWIGVEKGPRIGVIGVQKGPP